MPDKRRDKDYLGDIQEAMSRIGSYIDGLTYPKFLKDIKTQDAVVRNLEIIGEAAKLITPQLKANHPEMPWKQLAGVRDKLIHFYFGTDYKIVWTICRKELPKLSNSLSAIINSE